MSPSHAQSVTLVLNILTGLVSPQYHILHDDRFETASHALIPKSKWQQLAKFQSSVPKQNKGSEGDGLLPEPQLQIFQQPIQELDTNLDMNINSDGIKASEGVPEEEDQIEQDYHINDQIQTLRRSRRIRKPSLRLRESQETSNILLQSTIHPTVAFEVQVLTNILEELDIDQVHPIAFAASSDPDTLYLHEAMQQPDAEQFIKAMGEEIQAHEDNHHWEVVARDSISQGTPILPAIWSMRRKRRIDTRAIYKWKARLTIHGGKQEHGINYWETFSPVVRWSTTRLIFILAIKYNWATRQLDFILAYPQAPVKCDLYMEVPRGHHLYIERKRYAIKIKQNLYGQKQAGRVWNKYLTKTLTNNGFNQSQADECLFYFKQCIILIYVDDTIIAGPTDDNINEVVGILSSLFKIEDQGNISDYLGVQVKQLKDGSFHLSQPHLIDAILQDMHFQPNTKSVSTPALSSRILQPDIGGQPINQPWEYRSIIGKLNFLEKSTRPDIAYAVHQCARFTASPTESHAKAVKRIARYLLRTCNLALIYCPSERSIHCWADADFVGTWEKTIAMEDINAARSDLDT
jgi:Reverse transcriptase (RNA-dependent DNA polymerase)